MRIASRKLQIFLLVVGLLSACSKGESISASGESEDTKKKKKRKTESSGTSSDSGDDEAGDPQTLTLAPSASPSWALTLAPGETVVAMGRASANLVNVTTSAGSGFVIDLADGSIASAAPFSKFDPSKTTTLTVSPAYVWLLFKAENQIGRNKEPPDATFQFEVTKVALAGIVDNLGELAVIAATDEQLFMFDGAELVVFTFKDSALNVKSIPLPEGGLLEEEKLLGAGALGKPSDGAGVWLVSSKRVMLLDNRAAAAHWSVEELAFAEGGEPAAFLSLHYRLVDASLERDGSIVGMFGDRMLSTLEIVKD